MIRAVHQHTHTRVIYSRNNAILAWLTGTPHMSTDTVTCSKHFVTAPEEWHQLHYGYSSAISLQSSGGRRGVDESERNSRAHERRRSDRRSGPKEATSTCEWWITRCSALTLQWAELWGRKNGCHGYMSYKTRQSQATRYDKWSLFWHHFCPVYVP